MTGEKQDPLDLEAIEGRLKALPDTDWRLFRYDGKPIETKEQFDAADKAATLGWIGPVGFWATYADDSALNVDWESAQFIISSPTDIAALVAEVKRLRLACDIAESGEAWWKGVAINGFMEEDEGKRVVEELDKLRKEVAELKRTQVKDGGRGRLRSFPEPDDRITTAD